MKRTLLAIGMLVAIVVLTGCSGDVASPTHNEYDSHDDSHDVTTETTETQTMPQMQVGNRPVCTGLIIIGSCNTSQQGAQVAGADSKVKVPSPLEILPEKENTSPTLETICGSFLVAIGCIFWFLVIMWGLKKLFGGNEVYDVR